jgi:hypothetical protein
MVLSKKKDIITGGMRLYRQGGVYEKSEQRIR